MLLLPLLLWGAVLGQEDDLLRIDVYSGTWAAALSKRDGDAVAQRDIRGVVCVGLVTSDMACSWKRRVRGRWRTYYGWADLSRERDPQIKTVTRRPSDNR